MKFNGAPFFTTSAWNDGRMNAHGTCEISWIGNLLVIDLKGSFNNEGVEAAQKAIRKSVREKNYKRWNRLEVYGENTLATPDAIQTIRSFFNWYQMFGCEKFGVVCTDPIQLMLIESLQPNNLIAFDNVGQAKDFLLNSERLIS